MARHDTRTIWTAQFLQPLYSSRMPKENFRMGVLQRGKEASTWEWFHVGDRWVDINFVALWPCLKIQLRKNQRKD